MISEVFKNKTNTQDIRMPVVLEIFGGYLDEFCNLSLSKREVSRFAAAILMKGDKKQFKTTIDVYNFFKRWRVNMENVDDNDFFTDAIISFFGKDNLGLAINRTFATAYIIYEIFTSPEIPKSFDIDNVYGHMIYNKYIIGDSGVPAYLAHNASALFTCVNQLTTFATVYHLSIMDGKDKTIIKTWLQDEFITTFSFVFNQHEAFYEAIRK